jgi:hypothetical protein
MRPTSSFSSLLSIASRGMPFTAADGRAFVRLSVPCTGGFYILPLHSQAYRHWFFYQFFAEFGSVPSSHAFHSILNHLEAQASQAADCQSLAVWRRVGSRGPGPLPRQILLDLADDARQFVEISPEGWRVTAGLNALFQTSRSTVSLPEPVLPNPDKAPAEALAALRSCLNLPSRAAWVRCLAWLVSALRPVAPFPFLILKGPHASGKTFVARVLRTLIDPSASPLTPVPSSAREVIAAARQSWVLAFDHVSALSPALSGALCRLSVGLGASLRETPIHEPEPLQQYHRRPVLFTATERWSPPPELAGRALIVDLPFIPAEDRRAEAELLAVFHEAFPAILGALCSAVATALQRIPEMPPSRGRLPDALAWTLAAAPALALTEDEIRQAFAEPPPPHPVVDAVRRLLLDCPRWTGTASELLEQLVPLGSCCTPKGLSQQLRNNTLTLAASGIEIKFRRLHEGLRTIDLVRQPGDANLKKNVPDASPSLLPSPQVAQPEELLAS